MMNTPQLDLAKWTARLLFVVLVVEFGFCAELPAQNKKRAIEGIADNSFLVEEAYNQEPGVVQHVLTAEYGNDKNARGWAMSFTQEWPIFSQDHQFSYTIPFSFIHEGGRRQDGIEDILLNYRYQALDEARSRQPSPPDLAWFCPREVGTAVKGAG